MFCIVFLILFYFVYRFVEIFIYICLLFVVGLDMDVDMFWWVLVVVLIGEVLIIFEFVGGVIIEELVEGFIWLFGVLVILEEIFNELFVGFFRVFINFICDFERFFLFIFGLVFIFGFINFG